MKINNYFISILVSIFISCSSSQSPSTDELEDDPDQSSVVDTTKLIGTPLEGYETGDGLYWELFIENDYLTATVDQLPMPVFLAFFTKAEEEIVIEGIKIANDAIGYEVFQVVDEWSEQVRVIMKVNTVSDPSYFDDRPFEAMGYSHPRYRGFNGKYEAEKVVTDWQIDIVSGHVNKWVVAHELGHCFGIRSHALIDYENDTILPLEKTDVMSPGHSLSEPTLDSYTYMMQRQGEILLQHLGEIGHATLIKDLKETNKSVPLNEI